MVTKTEFQTGAKDRYGNDTTGTAYEKEIESVTGGALPDETKSAYFTNTALDPYEFYNAK